MMWLLFAQLGYVLAVVGLITGVGTLESGCAVIASGIAVGLLLQSVAIIASPDAFKANSN